MTTASNGMLPLHYASANESADDVIKVLLKSYPEACRVRDDAGNLPLHLAYAKKLVLEKVVKERLNDKTVAEIEASKWHKDDVDKQKFKAFIKEIDEILAGKVQLWKDAVAALAANADVMRTLLAATFEVLVPQTIPDEPFIVPVGVFTTQKEKMPMEEFQKLMPADKVARKKMVSEDKDRFGNLPIHRAAIKKTPSACVQALLEAWPDMIKEKDEFELTPLSLAISSKAHPAVVAVLLAKHPEAAAIAEHHEERLPLHFACDKQASDAVISKLLEVNFEASRVQTTHGYLPLHYAVERVSTEFVIKALLMAGPDGPKTHNKDGCLPLHCACQFGWTAASAMTVRELLAAYPAATQTADIRGCLPLHHAVMKHASEEVVQMLLDAYADGCKVADNDGNLPLHVAIEYEASDAVIALLIAKHSGACRELNHIKKLPMDLALEHGASEAVVSEIAAGEKVARDAEVGILAWLWG